jgi:hypothetical protein
LIPLRAISQVEYYTAWEKVKCAFLHFEDPKDDDHQNIRATKLKAPECVDTWASISFPSIKKFKKVFEAGGQNPFMDLDTLFPPPTCTDRPSCREALARWRAGVKEAIDGIPKLSEVIARRSKS